MTSDALRPDPHPVALLLPWYATGTLSTAERRIADEHLAVCASCRGELANIQALRSQLCQADMERRRALGGFAPVAPVTARRMAMFATLGLAGCVARGSSARPWLTAAVLTLILAQSGLLLWLTQPVPFANEIKSRALPTTLLRLLPRRTAQDQGLQLLLSATGSHILSGPAPDGSYLVAIPDVDLLQVEQRLRDLRGHADLVSSVERASP